MPGISIRSAVLFFTLAVLAVAPSAASAAVYVSPTGTDTGSCTSGSPCLTISYAIEQASSPDTVNIAAGTYMGSLNRGQSFSKELTFQGAGRDSTVLDASGPGGDFLLWSQDSPIEVRDLTLRDAVRGAAPDGAAVVAYDSVSGTHYDVTAHNISAIDNETVGNGAALYGANVTVSGNSTFTNNEASYGGAIYANNSVEVDPGDGQTTTFSDNYAGSDGGSIYAETGTATIDNSTFTGNPDPMGFSAGDDGGAVHAQSDTPAEFDLVVTDSTFTGFRIEGYYGGALTAYNGGAYLENVTATDGYTGEYGGGLYSDEDATIIDSTFERNDTDCCEGGGVYVDGKATVEDSIFRNNKADGGGDNGGGLYAAAGADISGSTFAGNEGRDGAGAEIRGETDGGHTIRIEDSIFEDNTASRYGGGVYLGGDVLASIISSTFDDNTSGSDGAGIEMNSGTVYGSTFSGNEITGSGQGAAIYMSYGPENVIENSTFTGNSGPGVIYTDNDDDPAITLDLNNVTVAGNTLTDLDFAAVQVAGDGTADLKVTNSIIAQDDGSGGEAQGCATPNAITSGGGNVIQNTTTGCDDLVGGPPAPTTRVSSAQIDLKALALNAPGTTETMAIGASSVATKAGVPGECKSVDQRGVSRPSGSCSSGAYQFTASVVNPKLRVSVVAPKRVKAGKAFKVTVRTRNTAQAGGTAESVRTCAKLPDGVFVVKRKGGKINGRKVCWLRSSLAGGRSASYSVEVRSAKGRSASLRLNGTASASNGEGATVRASSSSRVKVVRPSQPKPKPPTG